MSGPGIFAPTSPVVQGVGRALQPPQLPQMQQMGEQESQQLAMEYEHWQQARMAATQGDRPGILEGIGRGALQGLTFGFGDEIVARLRSLGPETYAQAVDGERQALDMFHQDHPILDIASQIGGGIAGAVVTGGIGTGARGIAGARTIVGGATGASRAAALVRLGRAAAQGAVYGGLYGAGTSEGGVKQRIEGGLAAAPSGAILGATLPILGRGVAAVSERLGITPAFRGATSAAKRWVMQALDQTGMTAQQLKARVLASTDKPELLADILGEPGAALSESAAVANTPGSQQLKSAMEARIPGMGQRALTDVRSLARVAPEDVTKTVEQLVGGRAAASKPLYDLAYAHGNLTSPELVGGNLQQLLGTPGMKQAYTEAQRLAAEEGVKLPQIGNLQNINVQTADYIKRALDDVLYVGRRSPLEAGGLGPSMERALKQTRGRFLNLVDAEVPQYAQARAAFQGPTRLLEQLEEGQSLWSATGTKLDQTLDDVSRLAPAEQQIWRRGAIDGLRAKMEEIATTRNQVRGFFDSPADQRRLRAIFGNAQTAKVFTDEIERESAMMSNFNRSFRGSQTAGRTQGFAAIEKSVGIKAITNALATPWKTTVGVVESAVGNSKARQTASEISRMLSAGAGGRQELINALDELIAAQDQRVQQIGRVRERYARVAGVEAPNRSKPGESLTPIE